MVFLGAAPGVGKTTAMLAEGARMSTDGRDVVVALVESHGRAGIEARTEGLERVPLRAVAYRDTTFDELDVDALLTRRPKWRWSTSSRTATSPGAATGSDGRMSRNCWPSVLT